MPLHAPKVSPDDLRKQDQQRQAAWQQVGALPQAELQALWAEAQTLSPSNLQMIDDELAGKRLSLSLLMTASQHPDFKKAVA